MGVQACIGFMAGVSRKFRVKFPAWLFAAMFPALVLVVPDPAAAHDGYAGWLIPGIDTSCCHEQDCQEVTAWRYSEASVSGYEALVEGQWCSVAPGAVLPASTPAPPGNGHVCVAPLSMEWPGADTIDPCQRIRCFKPGAGG